MSPRHAKPRTALRRACLTGAVGAATVGTTFMTIALAGPADSSARTAQAAAPDAIHARSISAPVRSTVAEHAARIPVPRTGNASEKQVKPPEGDAKKAERLPTATDAIKLAISQVGTTENAAGGTKFNQWFMSTPYAKQGAAQYGGSISDYANASWCDMFVSWVGDRLGVKGMGDNAFTPAHARWFQQQGHWGEVPKPGAVVFFSWNGGGIDGIDHVGLVIKDNHDGTIQTVEGNTDDAVKIRTRSTGQVVGYGYPEYAQ